MLTVTKELVEKIFLVLNVRYFCGELVVDEFDIDFLDTEWGFCVREDGIYIIGLTNEFEDEQQFISTLFHEMVHLYQYQKLKREPDHAHTFFAWAFFARKTGLDFSIIGD